MADTSMIAKNGKGSGNQSSQVVRDNSVYSLMSTFCNHTMSAKHVERFPHDCHLMPVLKTNFGFP